MQHGNAVPKVNRSAQECTRVKTENNIYLETDKGENEPIGRLTSEPIKERAEAVKGKEEPRITSLVIAFASVVEKVEENSKVVASSVSAYERAMTTDHQAAKPG